MKIKHTNRQVVRVWDLLCAEDIIFSWEDILIMNAGVWLLVDYLV